MAIQDELFEKKSLKVHSDRNKKTDANRQESSMPSYFAPLTGSFEDVISLGQYASTRYLQYAIATVKDRALPRATDGQKPVQARILYAMWQMSASVGNPRKKSARVVGDVLGKFHPHGDASVYDAMVRMSQDFTLRYALVDGEGNFGSRDGDDAAAMRYTEARLTGFANVLLAELNQGTVDFIPNYDGSILEPKSLPARLPIVLLNGSSGIAVGMATEIPSHNMLEIGNALIALIKKPNLSTKQLMRYIKGPDFPGGGHVINPMSDLHHVYDTGRGSIRVRARWALEKLSHGQWQVVFNELPPGTSSKKILEEIESLIAPQFKPGKRTLSTEQQREKQLMLSMVDRVRDESDRNDPVRLVFEPKTSRIDQADFLNLLLTKTSLETNVSINLVMIGLDGRPRNKNLGEALSEWLLFRFETVDKRTRYELEKVGNRLHLLEGRLLALLNVDEVVRIIRASDEPKQDLIAAFDLTEVQAEDILEMRLRQIARLEKIKIEKDISNLRKSKRALNKIIKNRKVLEKTVVDEISSDISAFGDDRRTLIKEAPRAAIEPRIIDDPVTVIFSKKGWIKCRQGWEVDENSLSFKDGDNLAACLKVKTTDQVVFLDSKGRAYTLSAGQLPSGRGDGVPVSSLVDVQSGAHILHCVSGSPGTKVLISSRGGYGFLSTIADMVSSRKSGRDFMTLASGDLMLPPCVYKDGTENQVAVVSSKSRLLIFPIFELKQMARGRGNILMGLHEGEEIVVSGVFNGRVLWVSGYGVRNNKSKEIRLGGEKLDRYIGRRARMGRALPQKLKTPVTIKI